MFPPVLGSSGAEGRAHSTAATGMLSATFVNILSEEAAIILIVLSSRNSTGIQGDQMPIANSSAKCKGKKNAYKVVDKLTGHLYIFCLKDIFSCNNKYMHYPGNKGHERRENHCLC